MILVLIIFSISWSCFVLAAYGYGRRHGRVKLLRVTVERNKLLACLIDASADLQTKRRDSPPASCTTNCEQDMTPIPAKYRDMLIDEIERAIDCESSLYATGYSDGTLYPRRKHIEEAIETWEHTVRNLENKP